MTYYKREIVFIMAPFIKDKLGHAAFPHFSITGFSNYETHIDYPHQATGFTLSPVVLFHGGNLLSWYLSGRLRETLCTKK